MSDRRHNNPGVTCYHTLVSHYHLAVNTNTHHQELRHFHFTDNTLDIIGPRINEKQKCGDKKVFEATGHVNNLHASVVEAPQRCAGAPSRFLTKNKE